MEKKEKNPKKPWRFPRLMEEKKLKKNKDDEIVVLTGDKYYLNPDKYYTICSRQRFLTGVSKKRSKN